MKLKFFSLLDFKYDAVAYEVLSKRLLETRGISRALIFDLLRGLTALTPYDADAHIIVCQRPRFDFFGRIPIFRHPTLIIAYDSLVLCHFSVLLPCNSVASEVIAGFAAMYTSDL